MSGCRLISIGMLLLLTVSSGCQIWNGGERANYQTIQANPKHDTEEAIEEHEEALEIIQRYLVGQKADLAKAEEHLQAALVADVTYGPAHNTLGLLYFRQRKLYLAAWEYEYAAKLMPDKMEPFFNLGLIYESIGKLDQALAYYDIAYAMAPQNGPAIGNLARIRIRMGEPVDDVRPLLEELTFHDNRPEWINWAKDLLGLHPLSPSEN